MNKHESKTCRSEVRHITAGIAAASAGLRKTLVQLDKCGATTADEDFKNRACLHADDIIERATALIREAKRVKGLCASKHAAISEVITRVSDGGSGKFEVRVCRDARVECVNAGWPAWMQGQQMEMD